MLRLIALLLLACALHVHAHPGTSRREPTVERPTVDKPTPQLARRVARVVDQYDNAIGCGIEPVRRRDVAVLEPESIGYGAEQGVFVAVITGDIGCLHGTGTIVSALVVVRSDGYGRLIVQPSESAPVSQFQLPVRYIERIVSNTPDTLILEGWTYRPEDCNCAPTQRVRFAIRFDAFSSRWTLRWKRLLKHREGEWGHP